MEGRLGPRHLASGCRVWATILRITPGLIVRRNARGKATAVDWLAEAYVRKRRHAVSMFRASQCAGHPTRPALGGFTSTLPRAPAIGQRAVPLPKEPHQFLEDQGMDHTRGAPFHPMTQGRIERYHRSPKNPVKLARLL